MAASANKSRIYLHLVESPAIAKDLQAFLLDAQACNLSSRTITYYRPPTPLARSQETGHNAGGSHDL